MQGKTTVACEDAELDRREGAGCAFLLDGTDAVPARSGFCDAPRQPGSSYCAPHHARCHLPSGSAAEQRQLREIEALAGVVGGKQGREARQPPDRLLRRLDRAVRAVSRPKCSRIVLERQMAAQRTISKRTAGASDADPTPERRQHGAIERLEQTIGDAEGRPSRPYRAVDTLAIMERRGSI